MESLISRTPSTLFPPHFCLAKCNELGWSLKLWVSFTRSLELSWWFKWSYKFTKQVLHLKPGLIIGVKHQQVVYSYWSWDPSPSEQCWQLRRQICTSSEWSACKTRVGQKWLGVLVIILLYQHCVVIPGNYPLLSLDKCSPNNRAG